MPPVIPPSIREDIAAAAQPEYPHHRPHRGIISCEDLNVRVEFQYNPAEVVEEKSVDWHTEKIYGLNEPLFSPGTGEARTIELTVRFDAHFDGLPDVGNYLDDLDRLFVPYGPDGAQTTEVPMFAQRPFTGGYIWGMFPVCKLVYGGKVRRVLPKSKRVVELFHGTTEGSQASRKPTRAEAQLSFYVVENIRSLVDIINISRLAPE